MSTVTQTITPELRTWIVEQARNGCQPEAVLASMKTSGWQEDVAIKAMEEALQGYLATAQPAAAAHPALEPFLAHTVPDPLPDPAVNTVWAGDRHVKVLLHLRLPRVVVFGGLLSDEECDALRAEANPRLSRSQTVVNDTGASEVNEVRTSDGMFFGRGESPLCKTIETRLSVLAGWPVENGEGLQILRYGPGAEYKPHYDYFDPAHAGTPTILRRGGQRVGTFVMYLNTPEQGGGTSFPDVGLEVAPVKGNAVFFSYDRPHPSTRSLHGGSSVLAGEKWVATKWLRQGRFD
jgi:prolyl 4-hydroxylase